MYLSVVSPGWETSGHRWALGMAAPRELHPGTVNSKSKTFEKWKPTVLLRFTFPMGYMCFDCTKRELMQLFCMEGLSHVPYRTKRNITGRESVDKLYRNKKRRVRKPPIWIDWPLATKITYRYKKTVLWIRIQNGFRFNGVSGPVSPSRRAKMTHKHRKKLINFLLLKCWMFSIEGWRLLL